MNFTINRALTYGKNAADVEDIKKIGHKINNFDDWYYEMVKLAKQNKNENNYMRAAYYYRMAEFFLPDTKREKDVCYNEFLSNFYKAVKEPLERFEVPYENSFLPALKIKAKNEKQIVLVHGGFDSFMEEFYLGVKPILDSGYTLILFEGPGQGKAIRDGLKFTYKWEKPLKAVLDYFSLENVPIIGISWGGFLAQRAAAFDKRISKVVAYNVMYDGLDVITNQMPKITRTIFKWLIRNNWKKTVIRLVNKAKKKSFTIAWGIKHGMYITGAKDPFEFFKMMSFHRLKDIGNLITQDVLLLAGEHDHLVPISHLRKSVKVLKNARSIKTRLFRKTEGGEQHCQTGAHHLAVNEIILWLENNK